MCVLEGRGLLTSWPQIRCPCAWKGYLPTVYQLIVIKKYHHLAVTTEYYYVHCENQVFCLPVAADTHNPQWIASAAIGYVFEL